MLSFFDTAVLQLRQYNGLITTNYFYIFVAFHYNETHVNILKK